MSFHYFVTFNIAVPELIFVAIHELIFV